MSFLSLPGLTSRPTNNANSYSGTSYISSLHNYLVSTPSISQGTKALEISPVHLSYLILRWEDIHIIPIPDSLVPLSDPFSLPPDRRRPVKTLLPPALPDGQIPNDVLSLRSVSMFSLSSPSRLMNGGGFWPFGTALTEEGMLKKIYSFFSRLPYLIITHNPKDTPSPNIEDFDPPVSAILPLPFPSLKKLKLIGLDPAFFRWEKVRWGLKVLELENSGEAVENGWSSGDERWMGEKIEWMSLIHLSISSNSLTEFNFPENSESLNHLRSVSLDSNLLISIPPSLAILHDLAFLSLSNNLISSLHQIRIALPQNLTSLCISHNRISTLTSIDSLISLEKLDIRFNLIQDILELSRAAMLPVLKEFWVKGNPCVEGKAMDITPEEINKRGGWRVIVFEYFEKEERGRSKHLLLDGHEISWSERRWVNYDSVLVQDDPEPLISPITSPNPSLPASPVLSGANSTSHPQANAILASPGTSEILIKKKKKQQVKKGQKRIINLNAAEDEGLLSEDDLITPTMESTFDATSARDRAKVLRKHTRGETEMGIGDGSGGGGMGWWGDNDRNETKSMSRGSSRHHRFKSSTVDLRPNQKRNPIPIFEETSFSNNKNDLTAGGKGKTGEFRKKVEALRNEVGDNWLRVWEQQQQQNLSSTSTLSTQKVDNGLKKDPETMTTEESLEAVKVKKVVKKGKSKPLTITPVED